MRCTKQIAVSAGGGGESVRGQHQFTVPVRRYFNAVEAPSYRPEQARAPASGSKLGSENRQPISGQGDGGKGRTGPRRLQPGGPAGQADQRQGGEQHDHGPFQRAAAAR